MKMVIGVKEVWLFMTGKLLRKNRNGSAVAAGAVVCPVAGACANAGTARAHNRNDSGILGETMRNQRVTAG